MRFCIFGNLQSKLFTDYVYRIVNEFPDSYFDIFSFAKSTMQPIKNVNQFVFEINNPLLRRLHRIRDYILESRLKKTLQKMDDYDICQIQFIDKRFATLSSIIAQKSKFLVSSVWGSDYYRSTERTKTIQKTLYEKSDYITFNSKKMMDDFNVYYKNEFQDKLSICTLGSQTLEVMNKLSSNKTSCKQAFDIPEEKTVITLGYNGNPEQQHIKVINSIVDLKNKLPSNLFFVIPMTYANRRRHKTQVEDLMRASGFDYKILDRFLTDKKTAKLRRASDIMIQVQTTDQFSGSMQEHIYEKNIVITGNWLPYKTLDEKNVFLLKVNTVDEVGNTLLYALKNLNTLKSKCEKSSKIIWELSSWESAINDWTKLYSRVKSKI